MPFKRGAKYKRKKPAAPPIVPVIVSPRQVIVPLLNPVEPPKTKNGNAYRGARKGENFARAFVPTEEQRGMVRMGVTFGIRRSYIASQIINANTGKPVDVSTLEKHFWDELENGAETIKLNLSASMYHNAVFCGDTRAAIFLLKARYGMKEEPNTLPASSVNIDPSVLRALDHEELLALQLLLTKAGVVPGGQLQQPQLQDIDGSSERVDEEQGNDD